MLNAFHDDVRVGDFYQVGPDRGGYVAEGGARDCFVLGSGPNKVSTVHLEQQPRDDGLLFSKASVQGENATSFGEDSKGGCEEVSGVDVCEMVQKPVGYNKINRLFFYWKRIANAVLIKNATFSVTVAGVLNVLKAFVQADVRNARWQRFDDFGGATANV